MTTLAGSRTQAPAAKRRGAAQSLLSLMGLALTLFVVPFVLVSRGVDPHFGAIGALLRDPVGAIHRVDKPLLYSGFGALLSLGAWTLWAYFVLCVAIDVLARSLGRLPLRMPGGRRLQSVIATLVGATLAIVPATKSSGHLRLPIARAELVIDAKPAASEYASTGVDLARDDAKLPPDTDAIEKVEGSQFVFYDVQPGDTLWSVAESTLGSPLRWREIADLNRGQPQPDGDELDDENWILPGWVLHLPPGARVPAQEATVYDAAASGGAVSNAALSNAAMSDAAASDAAVFDAVRISDAASSNDMSAVALSATRRSEPPPHESRGQRLPLAPIAYGIVGGSVVTLLDRMRRAQQRRRPGGVRITLPQGELAVFEQQLRSSADVDAVEVVTEALHMFEHARVEYERSTGARTALAALELSHDELMFNLAAGTFERSSRFPANLSPFLCDSSDGPWILPRVEVLAWRGCTDKDCRFRLPARAPTLVTVGDEASSAVLLNLRMIEVASFVGSDAAMVLQGLVVELGTAPWAELVDVRVAGHPGEIKSLDRVSQVKSVARLVSELRLRSKPSRVSGLETSEIRDSDDTGESREHLVVVCLPQAVSAEPEAVAQLASMAQNELVDVSVIVGGAVAGATIAMTVENGCLEVQVGPPEIAPLLVDQMLRPVQTPAEVLDVVEAVVATAADDEGEIIEIQSTPTGVAAEVEVLLLGEVSVKGADRPFSRAWTLELIAYLALHPSGASTDSWSTALWPDRLMAPASIHSTASAARRSLGVSTRGADHLPRAHGRLCLGPGVTSDWARFQQLAAVDTPESRTEALELIRGRPLQGLRSTDWALLDGTLATIEALVVDVATRHAENCLVIGNFGLAEVAARQALKISAYDERLYRILLRAADAAGNPEGVETTMRELVRLVAEDVEPFDAVHPETMQLYQSLTRRPGLVMRA